MDNFRVRTRLFALCAAICLMMVINGLWSFITFQEYKVGGPSYTRIVTNKDLVSDILPPPEFVLEAYLTSVQMATAKDAGSLEQLVTHFAKLRSDFDERHTYWQSVQLDKDIDNSFLKQSYAEGTAFFQVVSEQLIPAKRAGDQARVEGALSEASRHFEAHRGFIDQTVVLADRQAKTIETEVGARLSTASWITVCLMSLTLGFGALAAWRINVGITSPINQSVEVVECMASGNLGGEIVVSGHDEFSQLLAALQEMQSGISEMVLAIRQSANEVASSSAEIAQANSDLSNRTEQQAASLEEVAATMEEIDSAIKNHAEGVAKAHVLATRSAQVASKGGVAVDAVVATMREINASSSRIADIINVIEGISFQTNILAINAAIEAARAGEQGRGFAVVASEVRALAGHAANAAKEIEGLINTIVHQVAQGNTQVDAAGATMSEVVGSIGQLATIMNELSVANAEQSSGVSQVDGSISQIDRATQENAGLVEEMSASAEVLRRQAAGLVDLVAKFQTADALTALPTPALSHTTAAPIDLDVDQLIDAHRQWKTKLAQAAKQHEPIDTRALARDDCCALGRWIYGDGQTLSAKPVFKRLMSDHASFHRIAGDIGELINHQQYDKALAALVPGSQFAQATTSVVLDLSGLKQVSGAAA